MSKRHRQQRREPSSQQEGLWVASDVLPDGTYVVTVSLDGDRIWTLDREQAQRYATTCVAAAQRAEYDAAILRLLRHLGMGDEDITQFVGSLRMDRPPLDDEATAPLTLMPGVNMKGHPFVGLYMGGKQAGQVDLDQLREHALFVLETPAAVDLDAQLLRELLGMGLDEPVARSAVADIANWRKRG